MPRLFRHPVARLRLLGEFARISHKVAPLPNPGFVKVFRRALQLYREELYDPEEAYLDGVLDPAFPEKNIRDFVSKRMLMRIQGAVNPDSWTRLTEDKSIFYRYCTALGVATPELYALFFKDKAGCSPDGSVLQNRADWISFLDDKLPEEFVIKPAWGVYGTGISLLHRSTNGAFMDAAGLEQSAAEIYDTMLSHPEYHSFVIQKRLRNHAELVQLSDTEYLQTTRIVTYVDNSSHCNILFAFFKPIVGLNFSDNHDHGKTGNLVAQVDLQTGTLRPASIMTDDGSGEKTVLAHPVTGTPFEGFQMPLWKETCQLARQAAREFLPLRTVGWDIAITPDGPFIVEGNAWSDPFCFEGVRDIMTALLDQDGDATRTGKDRT
ncbi:MAG: sugar-transfer associated ATP-grasp domain-containing protein [Thiogranum sp.]